MGMLNMRKPILSLVGLLAVASLVGCQQESGKKGDSKELSQEQIIDKGLQAFEHLKNGKIHMEDEVVKVVNEPEEGEEKNATVKTSFDGSFELRPDYVRGIYTSAEGTQEIYWQSSVPFYKKAGDSIWRTGYSIREYDAGIGIFQDAIRYYQKNKKKMTVTEKKDAYVLYYQTDDVKNMINISRPIFLGGTTAFYGFSDKKVKGYFKVALSVSKDSFKPLSITYTSHGETAKKTMDLKSKITYSNQNTGVRVEEPEDFEQNTEHFDLNNEKGS